MIFVLLIVSTVVASVGDAFLKKSHGFTKLGPSIGAALVYLHAFYLFGVVLTVMPLGLGYASWSGLGVILTAIAGIVLFKERPNGPVVACMGAIILGIVLLNI
ncbi:DMT family transporter [Shouchella shacheensis]|uniref:DMT family transporter n=1 Tax=Shouchella shacheensis TaxID=1649580 RepID=UPI00073FFC79|nr:SMR family transporter [Shouchella shacheensis]